MKSKIEELKNLIEKSNKITILTGAGISTESGIADFRSPGGVWTKYKTVTIQEFLNDEEKRKYYWKYKHETIPSMLKAEPNAAHMAIGKLYSKNKLFWLITQNIDGLHSKSGVGEEKIVRLHGTNSQAVCLFCKKIIPIEAALEKINKGEDIPKCDNCRGLLKPDTVSFGQNLNPEHLSIAEQASRECDLFMALGSSLQVFPACSYVEIAYSNNIEVVIINRDSTPYDKLASICIHDSLARIMPLII